MAVPAGGGTRDGQVREHLDVGDEARELDVAGHVAPGALAQPVRLRPDQLVVPPHDRIGGVLGVDDAREPPRPELAPVQVCAQVGGLVDEAHAPAVVDDGGNLGAALVARGRQGPVHRREGGGPHPQGTVHLGQRLLDRGEDGLRREGPQRLAAHEQRGAVGLVHGVQLGAHRAKERRRGVLRGLEAGEPVQHRGHVGVLQRGRGTVAAREEFEGLDLPFVDPPGAGRRGEEDDGAVEGARAPKLGDDRGRGRLDARPAGGHAGVDADRLHGFAAAHLRDVESRGAAPEEHAPLAAHRLPGDGRGRGRRALGHEGFVDASRGAQVHAFGVAAEEADASAQDDVRRQEEDDGAQDGDADHEGGGARHVIAQGLDEQAPHAVEPAEDRQERPGHDDRARGSQDVLPEGLPRHVDEGRRLARAPIGLDDGVEPPDGEEGAGGHAEADLDGFRGPNRQARGGENARADVLHEDAGDVAAGDQDARGDRVPRPRTRHERGGHAHRVHGERSDHSQKRQTHDAHCARRAGPVQEGTRPGPPGRAAGLGALIVLVDSRRSE